MAKSKKAVKQAAATDSGSNKKVATTAANSSPATASKKAAKKAEKKAVSKPPLETKTVCFTDQESGKKFCGEMTEVPPSKKPAKITGTKRRIIRRRK